PDLGGVRFLVVGQGVEVLRLQRVPLAPLATVGGREDGHGRPAVVVDHLVHGDGDLTGERANHRAGVRRHAVEVHELADVDRLGQGHQVGHEDRTFIVTHDATGDTVELLPRVAGEDGRRVVELGERVLSVVEPLTVHALELPPLRVVARVGDQLVVKVAHLSPLRYVAAAR